MLGRVMDFQFGGKAAGGALLRSGDFGARGSIRQELAFS